MSKWGQKGGAAATIKGEQLQGTNEKSWATGKDNQYQISPAIDTVTINKKGFHQDDEKMMRTARAYSSMNQSVNGLLTGLLGRDGKYIADGAGDMLAKRQSIVDKYNEQISTDAIAGYSTPTTFSYSTGEKEQEAEGNSWQKQPNEAALSHPIYSEFGDANDEAKYQEGIDKKAGINMPDKGFSIINYGDKEVRPTTGFGTDANGESVSLPGQKSVQPMTYQINNVTKAKNYLKILQSRLSKEKMTQTEYNDGQKKIYELNRQIQQYK